jgi:hypothetical protein
MISVLLWLASLSISFLMMSFYPNLDTYRYWFIATVPFSFFIGLNAGLIKNSYLRVLYCSAIIIFFLIHTFPINKALKATVKKEALIAERVAKATFDSRFSNSLILYPDVPWIVNSNYIENMATAYSKLANRGSFHPFYPLELVSFYPEIAGDFDGIYEIRGDELIDIKGSLNERIKGFKDLLTGEKPNVKLLKKGKKIAMAIKCEPARGIIVLGINARLKDRFYALEHYAGKSYAPYIEEANLSDIFGIKDAEILKMENLSYRNKRWYIKGNTIPNGIAVVTLICENNEGKYSLPSDIIVLKY